MNIVKEELNRYRHMSFDIEKIRSLLEKAIQPLPDNFYDTFDYTITGNNLTHPLTLGVLCKILGSLHSAYNIGVDVRLNMAKNVKFQPDLVVYGNLFNNTDIKLFVDYESPNSSDARIPEKDMGAYLKWTTATGISAPYLVITTLPNKCSRCWQIRYTSEGGYNSIFQNRADDILRNPFTFWYKYYNECNCFIHDHVYFLNINGKQVDFIKCWNPIK